MLLALLQSGQFNKEQLPYLGLSSHFLAIFLFRFILFLSVITFLSPAQAQSSQEYSIGYKYLISEAIHAMAQHDDEEAIRLFKEASFLEPFSEEPLRYLAMLVPPDEGFDDDKEVTTSEEDNERASAIFDALDRFQAASTVKAAVVFSPEAQDAVPSTKRIVASSAKLAGVVFGIDKKEKDPIDVIAMDDIFKVDAQKPILRVAFGKSVILEGKDIRQILILNPEIVGAKQITRERIQIDGKHRGSTFLHIWDENGRRTIYIDVVLPVISLEEMALAAGPVEHVSPFHLKYSSDWSSFYTGGPGLMDVHKQNSFIYQQVGVEGETPYGFLDTSATINGFYPVESVPNYTLGLRDVPVPGTTNLKVRVFDAQRGLSPMTLPDTYLRGIFVDTRLFEEAVGLAVTHGQLQPVFGGFSLNSSSKIESYVNGFRMVLFPKDRENYLAFNYAESYGADRSLQAANKVYSIEAKKTIDKLILNTELARNDANSSAMTGGIKWSQGSFQSNITARNINSAYTSVLGPSMAQGEIGAMWTTDTDWEKLKFSSVVDTYRNRAFFNPDNPDGYNLNTSVNVKVPLNDRYAVEMNTNYVDTPQDISPRRSITLGNRLIRNLNVWGGRTGSISTGFVTQQARYPLTPLSEYDRVSEMTGLQLPLILGLSYNASYEYTWLKDIASGERTHPQVFYTGLSGFSSFNDMTSGNFSLTYRREKGFHSTNSFLAGEDSMGVSAGVDYHPHKDVNYFMDGSMRKVWPQASSMPAFNDVAVHCGMRMNWGLPLTWDPQGVVAGTVFKDMDADGVKKADEKGISGVKIKVGDKEVVTDTQGNFSVKVRAKKVLVRPVFETLPAGYAFSTQTSYKVQIKPGIIQRADFGLTTRSGIYGVAFVDKNGNNLPDKSDEFVQFISVVLDGKRTLRTDNRGVYYFRNIGIGKHIVTIDMKGMPPQYIPLIKLKHEINLGEGATYTLNIPLRLNDTKSDQQ